MIVSVESIKFTSPKGFIVIEGPNGSGKSTLIGSLNSYLTKLGKAVQCTFEPGATALGQTLRKLLLEKLAGPITPAAELLLFAADRAEHTAKVISPALTKKEVVLCDRYFYSTLAFQGFGRGLNQSQILASTEIAVGGAAPEGIYPDCVLLLDLPVEEGLKRARLRNSRASDSFEAEELAFHERLRSGFLEIARTRPEPFVVIDACRNQREVEEEAKLLVDKLVSALPSK